MNNLIEFFKKAFHIIVLAVLLILSIVMLGKSLSFNGYRLARATQSVVGPIQKSGAGMIHRFRLGPENEALVKQNIELLRERENMFIEKVDTTLTAMSRPDSVNRQQVRLYDYTYAHVIFRTTDRAFNYMIVDKGEKDGVTRDMAVLSPANQNGTVIWEDNDPRVAYLEAIPQHSEINIGDSVFTNGYSNIFPKGLFIGTVKEVQVGNNASFLTIKVNLATHYTDIYTVYLVENLYKSELDTLKANFKDE